MSDLSDAIRISENEIAIRRKEKLIEEIEDRHCKECDRQITFCGSRCNNFTCLCELNNAIAKLKEENEKLIKEKVEQDEIQIG